MAARGSQVNGALCVSRTVVADQHDWASIYGPLHQRPFCICWFHHGAEIQQAIPILGVPNARFAGAGGPGSLTEKNRSFDLRCYRSPFTCLSKRWNLEI